MMYFIIFMIYLATIVNANPTSPSSLIIKPNPSIPTFNLIINRT